MKLKDIYRSNKPVISYEVFPPKGDAIGQKEKTEDLFNELRIISKFNPSFISVTYGAGGSTRDTTLNLVLKMEKETGIQPMPHFTCVGTTRESIFDYLKVFQDSNIENVLALRGDPPIGQGTFVKPENGFGYANELVEFIKSNTSLDIAVAGYPECHKDCDSIDKDVINLKRKVDAGASVIITQLFYDNDYFFNFVEKARKTGILIPIIPCILPVTNLGQIEKMATLCACSLPDKFISKLKKYEEDKEAQKAIGIEYAIEQCKGLISFGVQGLHFCTLNKSFATEKILSAIKLD